MARKLTSLLLALLLMGTTLPARAQMLQVLWVDPVQGPICAGPLGPGPCAAIGQWMRTHPSGMASGMGSPPPILPTTIPATGEVRQQVEGMDPLYSSVSSSSVSGALQCAQMTNQMQAADVQSFLWCTHGALALNRDEAILLSCAEHSTGSRNEMLGCAGRGIIGSRLSPEQVKAVDCATSHYDDEDAFAGCVAQNLVADRLSPQQRRLLDCASDGEYQSSKFAGCAARAMLGDRLPPDASAAVECAVESNGDYAQFGGCAANKFLNLHLNPEQAIAVECVVESGGQPYVAAGCAASRLTARELEKCAAYGIGGDRGCFGNNNDLVGRNGFVVRNLAGLAGGSNSVVRDPGQILGGPNSVFNNPRQVLGGPNSAPNVVLRNIPSPPAIQVGKIGNLEFASLGADEQPTSWATSIERSSCLLVHLGPRGFTLTP